MPDSTRDPNDLSLGFTEGLYEAYLRDPWQVPTAWRRYFGGLGPAPDGYAALPAGIAAVTPARAPLSPPSSAPLATPAAPLGPASLPAAPATPAPAVPAPAAPGPAAPTAAAAAAAHAAQREAQQNRVAQLVRNYRVRGHRLASLDPLGLPAPPPPELDPAYYGFGEADLDRVFDAGQLQPGARLTLRAILEKLRRTYCRSIGVQFMHIDDLAVREWLQERMEGSENSLALTRAEQLRILTRLTDAVIFEDFVQKKFVGAKSFSLEGAESLIPLLDLAIEHAGGQGVEEIVIGMAHRGRLNVLANVLGKSPRLIFREFEDRDAEQWLGSGDVKYHLGYHADWRTQGGRDVHLALCFNPSHLEFVNPVAMGRVRAKQDRLGDERRERSLLLLIHGDAAFAGEGIVQETLNLSELGAYTTGGALHVIVNNQIGFTTNPAESRSTTYATDVARMLQIPIFHVNGEDPEAVAQVVRLALDYRRRFGRDVVVDMYCYRRRGHNETDEPAFTQPLLVRQIRGRPSVREAYLERLLALGEISRAVADELAAARREHLEEELSLGRSHADDDSLRRGRPSSLGRIWQAYRGGPDADVPEVPTGVPREILAGLLARLGEAPPEFHPHPKAARLLEQRRQMAAGERPLDWAAAEALAFATLAVGGTRVRLTGQDSERGTFSHRHAVLHDIETGRAWAPLQHLAPDQAPVDIRNSPLSEAGVLGFEYGYSLGYPDALVLWEAQFGDFVNAAQVIVDQFLAGAEDKWRSLSGLVLLLPHGFEGQGPEHSSARLERFLQLAAEDNLQVAVPSTPAQYFHLLRRQALRPWRKPLVVMTPKSMLRSPAAVSTLDELAGGSFRRVLPDARAPEAARTTARVLLCAGKLAHELAEERARRGRGDVAILRVEQIYPLADAALAAALAPYAEGTPVVWAQEEPVNMGAWPHLRLRFGERLLGRWPLGVVARAESASPATGSPGSHRLEQQRIYDEAFAPAPARPARPTRRAKKESR